MFVRLLQDIPCQDSQESQGRGVQAYQAAEGPHQGWRAQQEAVGRSHGVSVSWTGEDDSLWICWPKVFFFLGETWYDCLASIGDFRPNAKQNYMRNEITYSIKSLQRLLHTLKLKHLNSSVRFVWRSVVKANQHWGSPNQMIDWGCAVKSDKVAVSVRKQILLSSQLCILFLQKFLNKVEEVFLCICCQEVVFQPITTECQHNVCRVRNFNCTKCRNLQKQWPRFSWKTWLQYSAIKLTFKLFIFTSVNIGCSFSLSMTSVI